MQKVFLDLQGNKHRLRLSYADGLGRPSIQVQKGASQNGEDIVSLSIYDGRGRKSQEYLPTPQIFNPNGRTGDIVKSGEDFYQDRIAFDKYTFEGVDQHFLVRKSGPGIEWKVQDRALDLQYATNMESGEMACLDLIVGNNLSISPLLPIPSAADFSPLPSTGLKSSGFLSQGSVHLRKIIDEQKNRTLVFEDVLGNKLLERRIVGRDFFDTYYVYDERLRLRMVLPPMASKKLFESKTKGFWLENDDIIKQFAYTYGYDQENRLIIKNLPGREDIFMVYDRSGQLILSQDGNERSRGVWEARAYDSFGRIAYRFELKAGSQSFYKLRLRFGAVNVIEHRTEGGERMKDLPYTRKHFKESEIGRLLQANFYDDYTFRRYESSDAQQAFVHGGLSAKDRISGQRIYLLQSQDESSNPAYRLEQYAYDERGRLQEKHILFPKGETLRNKYAYSFANELTKETVRTEQIQPIHLVREEEYTYEYDLWGRITNTYYKLDQKPPILLSSCGYDKVGRLDSKRRSGSDNDITYSYDFRSHLQELNYGTYYKEEFYYTHSRGNEVTPRYDGNIAGILRSTGPNYWEFAAYEYDEAGRLTDVQTSFMKSTHGSPRRFRNSYAYDSNGNMSKQKRGLDSYSVEDLSYQYLGNQLLSVSARRPVNPGAYGEDRFVGNQDGKTTFVYDANGNTIRDVGRDMDTEYNRLNLPSRVSASNGQSEIKYAYFSDGLKYKEEYSYPAPTVFAPIVGDHQLGDFSPAPPKGFYAHTYIGRTCIKTEVTGFFRPHVEIPAYLYYSHIARTDHPEGYSDQAGEIYFFVKDYLGSVRLIRDLAGRVYSAHQYADFGPEKKLQIEDLGLKQASGLSYHPNRYTGKPVEKMFGLNSLDYGARLYRPDIARFTTQDPLAEQYYSLSPYAYCANNPIRYVDPDGRKFTEAAWKQVNRLIEDINGRLHRNASLIANNKERIDAGGLSKGKIKSLQRQMNKLNENSSELEKVKSEIELLAASDQVYDIKEDYSMNRSTPEGNEYMNAAEFNNGSFTLLMGDLSLASLAHELKHAYQFEIGSFSSGRRKDGSPFYDRTDEWEAYARETLFGRSRIYSLPSIYDRLQEGPADATKLAPIVLSRPTELQRLANTTRSAFRVNGVTYVNQKK